MNCGACKFWQLTEEPAENFTGAGRCRRNAPRPAHEDILALVLILRDRGTLEIDPSEPNSPDQRIDYCRPKWPITLGDEFCGEFALRQEHRGFV